MKASTKRKEKRDFIAIAEMLNMLRKERGPEVFSVKVLRQDLKGIIPTNPGSLTALTNLGIVIRTKRGYYTFPKDPICWTKVREYYVTNRKRQVKTPTSDESLTQTSTELSASSADDYHPRELTSEDEQSALALLKRLGYIVLKMM